MTRYFKPRARDDLYSLLPEIYCVRDMQGDQLGNSGSTEVLRSFLDIVQHQVDRIHDDINTLYDDIFIETCRDDLIPYFGDLLGVDLLFRLPEENRREIARTIHFRRRKGTLPALEELSRDVTGWFSRIVEFYTNLLWTQNMNHIRLKDSMLADLKDSSIMYRINGPFDTTMRSVDVRKPVREQGWYNIKNIGIFSWRLRIFPLRNVKPDQFISTDLLRYHFNPLGQTLPLFTKPQYFRGMKIHEYDVPGPIPHYDTTSLKENFYGQDRGMSIYLDDELVCPQTIQFMDLSSWQEVPDGKIGIDVRLGRFAFSRDLDPGKKKLRVDYNYAFSAHIGAGPYEREDSLFCEGDIIVQGHEPAMFIRVGKNRETDVETIQNAYTLWMDSGIPDAVIQIEDSSTYGGNLDVILPQADSKLVLQAADLTRPVLKKIGNLDLKGTSSGDQGKVVINGFLITGNPNIRIHSGIIECNIKYCTIDPGGGIDPLGTSLRHRFKSMEMSEAEPGLEIIIDHSIVGGLKIPETIQRVIIRDSIVDAGSGIAIGCMGEDDEISGPIAHLERSTIIGRAWFKKVVMASEVMFTDIISVRQKQDGCIRFCYIPTGSVTPRTYECIMEDQFIPGRGVVSRKPVFTSQQYGDPGYCQLGHHCPDVIKTGAEDGSEIGVFQSAYNTYRLQNLMKKLDEFMPVGLDPAIIFIT